MSKNTPLERRNLLMRIAVHPVTREDFSEFHDWRNKEWESHSERRFKELGLSRNPRLREGRRENFVRSMMKAGFLTCGRKTNILRVTKKGFSWIHSVDAAEMLKRFRNVSQCTSGLLSFGA